MLSGRTVPFLKSIPSRCRPTLQRCLVALLFSPLPRPPSPLQGEIIKCIFLKNNKPSVCLENNQKCCTSTLLCLCLGILFYFIFLNRHVVKKGASVMLKTDLNKRDLNRPFLVVKELLTTTASKNTTWFPHLLHFFFLWHFWWHLGKRGKEGGHGPLFVCDWFFLFSLKDCNGISAHFFVSTLLYFCYLFFCSMPSIYLSRSTETWNHFRVNKRHIFFLHFNYFLTVSFVHSWESLLLVFF